MKKKYLKLISILLSTTIILTSININVFANEINNKDFLTQIIQNDNELNDDSNLHRNEQDENEKSEQLEDGNNIEENTLDVEQDFDVSQNIKTFNTLDGDMFGAGTLEDPYQISNKEQLKNIENNMSGNYILTSDINLEGERFLPIGYGTSETAYSKFLGTLDGQGYKISNLEINLNASVGLFAELSFATIKNLVLENFNTEAKSYAGTLAGQARESKIENVISKNVNVYCKDFQVGGGLLGYSNKVDVNNSHVDGVVRAQGDFIGGLVGNARDSNFYKSSFVGEVSSTSNGYYGDGLCVGGLIGSGKNVVIEECFVEANISCVNGYVGGIIGQISGTLDISNSFVIGDLSGAVSIGGLVATSKSSLPTNINITNSYFVGGILSGNSLNDGGLVLNYISTKSNIINSYFDSDKSNIKTPTEQGRTTLQLKQKANYANWSLDVWDIEDEYLPSLKWFNDSGEEPLEPSKLKGNGTEDSPYEITNADDFYEIEKDMTAHYVLVNNINFNGENFNPIGLTKKESFQGTLNGDGFIIENMIIDNSNIETVALFYKLENSFIREVIFDNITLKSSNVDSTTSLFGNVENTSFLNCIVFDLNIESESENIGGLISNGDNVIIEGVSIYGNLKSSNGIIGGIGSTIENSKINTCSYVGKIESDNIVAGFFGNMIKSELNNSYSMATLSSKTRYGLAKDMYDDSTITNSYFDSSLSRINAPSEQAKTSKEMLSEDLFENKGRLANGWIFEPFHLRDPMIDIFIYINEWFINKSNKELNPELKERLEKLTDDIKNFVIHEYDDFEKNKEIEVVIAIDSSSYMDKYSRGVALEMAQKLSDELYIYSKGASNDYGNEKFEETMKIGLIDFNNNPLWFSRIIGKQKYLNKGLDSINDFNLYYNPYTYTAILDAAFGFQNDYAPNHFDPLVVHDDNVERHIITLTSGTTKDDAINLGLEKMKVNNLALNNNIKLHFIELNEKSGLGNSDLIKISKDSEGIYEKIKLISEDESENIKNALENILFDILGEEEKWKIPESIRGLLIFVGHQWSTLGNSEYPEASDDIFDDESDLHVGAQDYIIITSNGVLYNRYTDKNGVEKEILTSEDVSRLSFPNLSEVEEKIYKNDLHLSITKEPLYSNTYSIDHDFNNFSEKYKNDLEEINGTSNLVANEHTSFNIDIDEHLKNGNLDSLVENEYKNTARKILLKDKNASLWFSLPLMEKVIGMADKFIEPYQVNVIDAVKDAMEELEKELGINNIWKNNVRGFLFSSENMINHENRNFDYEFVEHYEKRIIGEKIEVSSGVKRNAVLDLAIATSDYVHSESIDKKLLWIPHYHTMCSKTPTGSLTDDIILALITNETNIFDYVTIQPSTYNVEHKPQGEDFAADNMIITRESLESKAVKAYNYTHPAKGVDGGRPEITTEKVVVDRNNSKLLAKIRSGGEPQRPIEDGIKNSNTIIGFEYEIDKSFEKPEYADALEKYNVLDKYALQGVPYTIYAETSDGFSEKTPGINAILQKWLKIN